MKKYKVQQRKPVGSDSAKHIKLLRQKQYDEIIYVDAYLDKVFKEMKSGLRIKKPKLVLLYREIQEISLDIDESLVAIL